MDRVITDYLIVMSDEGFVELEEKVNKLMQDGWQPLGGLCLTELVSMGDYDARIFYQTMVGYMK